MKVRGTIWSWCCSLKLAIVLASSATLIVMAGSVLMPGRPRLFGSMDRLPLAEWWHSYGAPALGITWWLPLAGFLLLLLGINTSCCFLDWLFHLRSRWRKTGEYFIHLGFVLLLLGYGWGSIAGQRTGGVEIPVGQTAPIPGLKGHYLRLERLEAVFAGGRPVDFRADLQLLRGDRVVARQTARTNHPLMYGSLVAILSSAEQRTFDLRIQPVGIFTVTRDPGAPLAGAGGLLMLAGVLLALFSFYAKRRRGDRPEIDL